MMWKPEFEMECIYLLRYNRNSVVFFKKSSILVFPFEFASSVPILICKVIKIINNITLATRSMVSNHT